ncbi:MAG TPA: hypothetical protein VIS31_13580 [Woeseiaceae bacterium]
MAKRIEPGACYAAFVCEAHVPAPGEQASIAGVQEPALRGDEEPA